MSGIFAPCRDCKSREIKLHEFPCNKCSVEKDFPYYVKKPPVVNKELFILFPKG